MTILTLYDYSVQKLFPNLKRLNFSRGDLNQDTRESNLKLLPECVNFFILPYDTFTSDAESLAFFKDLGLFDSSLYIISLPEDSARKKQKIPQAVKDISCKVAALKQLKTTVCESLCVDSTKEGCLDQFIQNKIDTLTQNSKDLQSDKFSWVINYSLPDLTFEFYKASEPDKKTRIILPFTLHAFKFLSYLEMTDQRIDTAKTYTTLPKLANSVFEMKTLNSTYLTLHRHVLAGKNGNQYLKNRSKWRKDVSFEDPCAQFDSEYYFYYYQLLNGQAVELKDEVAQNGSPVFDFVLSMPGANARYFNALLNNNEPDLRLRLTLVLYIRDPQTNKYVGEIAYRTRNFTREEFNEKRPVQRANQYLKNIVSEYNIGRRKIFTNLSDSPSQADSFLFRDEVEIYTDCIAKADSIIRQIDATIDQLENVLKNNLSFFVQKIDSFTVPTRPPLESNS